MRTFADSGPVALVLAIKVDRTVFRELLDLDATSELGQVTRKGSIAYVQSLFHRAHVLFQGGVAQHCILCAFAIGPASELGHGLRGCDQASTTRGRSSVRYRVHR